MKLHADKAYGQNAITAHGPGHVAINGRRIEASVIVQPGQLQENWPVKSVDDLTAELLAPLAALKSDVILLGTGMRQRFPSPAVLRPLIEARIGVEVMDTAAACRTYNILLAEGRAPLAALIVE
ncbi:MAG TPA: Mth938-like domain-containing protein [Rhodocyclaceae bacterium]